MFPLERCDYLMLRPFGWSLSALLAFLSDLSRGRDDCGN